MIVSKLTKYGLKSEKYFVEVQDLFLSKIDLITTLINDLELVTRLMSNPLISKGEDKANTDIISVDDATDEQMMLDLQRKSKIIYSDLFQNILLCLRSVQKNELAIQSLFVDKV